MTFWRTKSEIVYSSLRAIVYGMMNDIVLQGTIISWNRYLNIATVIGMLKLKGNFFYTVINAYSILIKNK